VGEVEDGVRSEQVVRLRSHGAKNGVDLYVASGGKAGYQDCSEGRDLGKELSAGFECI